MLRFFPIVILAFVLFFPSLANCQTKPGNLGLLRDLGVDRIRVDSLGRCQVLNVRESYPVVLLLGSKSVLNSLELTQQQAGGIDGELERLEEQLKGLLSEPARQVREIKLSWDRIEPILGIDQMDHLHRWQAMRWSKGCFRVERENLKRAEALLADAAFWKSIENESRLSRKVAINGVLKCLSSAQVDRIKEILDDDEVLFGLHLRSDILHFQLAHNQWRAVDSPESPFADFLFLGNYQLFPDGTIGYEYFTANAEAVPVMVKLKVFFDSEFRQRLQLIDSQVEQVAKIATELSGARDKIASESEQPLTSEQLKRHLKSYESSASEALEELLLPHQRELVKEELCAQLYPRLGIVWSLTQGNLGRLIKVSDRQKERIVSESGKMAKRLQSRARQLREKLNSDFEIPTILSHEVTFVFPIQPKDAMFCDAPESVIPQSMLIDRNGNLQSLMQIRSRYFDETELKSESRYSGN